MNQEEPEDDESDDDERVRDDDEEDTPDENSEEEELPLDFFLEEVEEGVVEGEDLDEVEEGDVEGEETTQGDTLAGTTQGDGGISSAIFYRSIAIKDPHQKEGK